MKTLYRLLMASTILSGVVSVQAAKASIPTGATAKEISVVVGQSVIMLAQAGEPEKNGVRGPEKKPDSKPPTKPAAPAKSPAVAPAPPPRQPATPPAAARPPERVAPPAATHPVTSPPAAQVPARPHAPPAAQSAPHVVPPAVQGQPPAVRGRPVAPPPPAAQIKPRLVPPAGQGESPKGPVPPVPPPPAAQAPLRPNAPPAAQTTPHVVPPAAQGQPPAVLGRPFAPPPAAQTRPQSMPAAPQAGASPPPPAGVAPNMQGAPLQRSGVPAPSAQQARPIAPAAAGLGISPQSAQGQPIRRIEELRGERRESTEGGRTTIREPDRTIIREGGQTVVRHSEVDRFRYGAQDVRMERRGNDNVTIVVRPGGDRIVTVVDDNGFLLRRTRILPDGREIILIDNRPRGPGFARGGGYGGFFLNLPPPAIHIPRNRYIVDDDDASPALLYETLLAPPIERIDRRYSLDEIRYSEPLRDRMRRIDLNTVTFDTGSWELTPDQVQTLAAIADGLKRAIEHNPREVFLIEGYTDAVGSEIDNLSLSDRRAESVAIALTQQFGVPAENLSTQGYGEQFLKIQTNGPMRANRRVAVRRITPLLTGQTQ